MMEDKKGLFYYIGRLFETYGILVLIFMAVNLFVGEGASEYSTLFKYGKQGLSAATLGELLLLAFLITVAYFIFMSDSIIKNMRVPLRTTLYLIAVTIFIIIMIFAFGWFPVDLPMAWIGFAVSYMLSLIVSVVITFAKERMENNRMQEALKRYNSEK